MRRSLAVAPSALSFFSSSSENLPSKRSSVREKTVLVPEKKAFSLLMRRR